MSRITQGNVWLRAAGEIILIVIGVMTALAADRWNSRRLAAQTELQYLVSLRSDLVGDTAQLRNSLDFIKRRSESATSLLHWIEGGEMPTNLSSALFRAGDDAFYQFTSPTYIDLVQNGRLGIVRDLQLRNDIVEYYQSIETLAPQLRQLDLEGPSSFRAEIWALIPRQAWVPETFLRFDEIPGPGDTAMVKAVLGSVRT